jgi:hypothetical protein
LSERTRTAEPSEVAPTRATAHLPGLDIEITHRRSPDGEAEQISITMQAIPSFEAFGRYLEATNPFAFWMQAVERAWSPWLDATRALTSPVSASDQRPKLKAD